MFENLKVLNIFKILFYVINKSFPVRMQKISKPNYNLFFSTLIFQDHITDTLKFLKSIKLFQEI